MSDPRSGGQFWNGRVATGARCAIIYRGSKHSRWSRAAGMARDIDWEIPAELQPDPEECAFDLDRALGSVLGVHATVPEDAFTAGTLGTERAGSGVLICKEGLVLTIGYLITEAESIWLTSSIGGAVPGHVLGYDLKTGFVLVQTRGRLFFLAAE